MSDSDTADAGSLPLGLSSRGLQEVFPFFFALDHELRLMQFGRSLPKVCRNLSVGAPLSSVFKISRPRLKPSFDALVRAIGNSFFLDSLTMPVQMRGQMYHEEERGLLLFLGAPWFTDLESLQSTKLALSDFTVHDPIVDFLYMVQAKSIALADAQKLSETVSKQRDDLIAVNSQLEQALAAKSQFLANTSHELRTPLNGIIGMASLLVRMKLSSQQRHYADTILRSGRTLLGVVNDILDISKIEAGRMTLEILDFNLHHLLGEIIDNIAVMAQSKGLELLYTIDADVPAWLEGDPMRLGQVLSNLLGNAVKFTSQGEVVLRVSRSAAPPPAVVLRIEVRDTGIGIAEVDLPRIFQPFSQADNSMSRRFGGTGLGLALCRDIARLMGGEIGVESHPGVGSRFWFTAQLRTSTKSRTAPLMLRETFLDRRRVLVVDDNVSNREYLQELIRQWGGVVDACESGAQALERLRRMFAANLPYDLLVLDMVMPGMSGMELVAALASDPQFDSVLLVMLSSLDPESHRQHPQRKRINAHLTKPVHPAALRERLSELLRARASSAGQPPVSLGGESSDAFAPIDPSAELPPSAPQLLVVDDNPVNLEVAAHMIETLGYRAELVSNGAEAVTALSKRPYALVLMDLQMPVMSGYEATEAIRAQEGDARHTPIIAMTAHAMATDRRRAIDAGMDDYIAKPIELAALESLLQQWLPEPAPSSPPRPEPPAPVAPLPAVPDVIDRTALQELSQYQPAGGEDLIAKILRTYLSDLSERLPAVRAAAASQDARSLARIGHALKSSSKLVGARGLAAVCGELAECGESTERARLAALVADFLEQAAQVQSALGPLLAVRSPP